MARHQVLGAEVARTAVATNARRHWKTTWSGSGERERVSRHAFATLMIESGEDLGTVSRILEHADFATTADVYAHLTPAMLDRAAERMNGILGV